MNPSFVLSCVAVLLAVVACVAAFRSNRGLSLTEIAIRSVAYGQQMGGNNMDRLRIALEAAKRLDASDNGVRNFSDAQLRIALEAELNRGK